MNDIRRKISRIVDEMIVFQFNAGAEDVQMNLRRQKDGIELLFESSYPPGQDMTEQADRLNRYLTVERNEAMEAYFWGLAGEDDGCETSELHLVGQMVDQAEAKWQDGKLSIRLFRKFKKL